MTELCPIPALSLRALVLAVEIHDGTSSFRMLLSTRTDLRGADAAAAANGYGRELGVWVLPAGARLLPDGSGLVAIGNAPSLTRLFAERGSLLPLDEVPGEWLTPEHPSYAEARRLIGERLGLSGRWQVGPEGDPAQLYQEESDDRNVAHALNTWSTYVRNQVAPDRRAGWAEPTVTRLAQRLTLSPERVRAALHRLGREVAA